MKQELQNLLAQGKTKQVIDKLRQLNLADADLNAEVVQLSARFAQYERQQRMGVEDPSVLGRELNKINMALLAVIDRLKEEDSSSFFSPLRKRGCIINVSIVFGAIGLIASIAQISGYSIKDLFSNNKDGQLINTTVFVENKKHELVLKQQGKIIMEVTGGESKEEDIDSKGSASFKNVKVGDKVRLKVNFSEPYSPIDSNALHTITADGRITLTVALQNLNRVYGTVLSGDKFLEGVLVDVQGLRDTTDLTGRFEIFIPESAQRQNQEVKFLKKGYKVLIKNALPQTDAPLNVVMEKAK